MDYSATLWQCRRGLKELDVLLEPYCIRHYQQLSDAEKQLFHELLSHEDIDLYDWFFTDLAAPTEALAELIKTIKEEPPFY